MYVGLTKDESYNLKIVFSKTNSMNCPVWRRKSEYVYPSLDSSMIRKYLVWLNENKKLWQQWKKQDSFLWEFILCASDTTIPGQNTGASREEAADVSGLLEAVEIWGHHLCSTGLVRENCVKISPRSSLLVFVKASVYRGSTKRKHCSRELFHFQGL